MKLKMKKFQPIRSHEILNFIRKITKNSGFFRIQLVKKNPLMRFPHTLIEILIEFGEGDLKLWNLDLAFD